MKALTPAARLPRTTGLPTFLHVPSRRSIPNHEGSPVVALCALLPHPPSSAPPVCFRLAFIPAGSPPSPRRIGFALRYRPPVRLRLLPTPPLRDPVTFGYRALAYPDLDF